MNIAFFTDTYLPTVDGVVTSILTTKKALEALGHRVMVFAPGRKGAPDDPGTRYVWAKAFRRYPDYALAFLPSRDADHLRDFGAEVVHSHGITFMAVKAMWAGWLLDLPIVQTWHTMIHDAIPFYSPFALNPRLLERLLRIYLRRYLRKCDEVFALTRSVRSELLEIAPEIRRCRVIPIGVDTARYRPETDGGWIREKWGIGDDPLILYAGRLSPEKNLPVLFAAMASVRRDLPNAKFLVMGGGPQLQAYRYLVKDLGLSETIRFTGFVPAEHVPAYYAACDVFATASTFEVHPMTVLEALASGKPVAGADARGIPEFVTDGVTGHLFRPNDPVDAAEAIVRCLGRDDFRPACRDVAERFSLEKCTRQQVAAFQALRRDWDSGAIRHGTGRVFG